MNSLMIRASRLDRSEPSRTASFWNVARRATIGRRLGRVALAAVGMIAACWTVSRGGRRLAAVARAPQRCGVARDGIVGTSSPAHKSQLRWRVPISSGYSAPTVADGRVYVMDRITEPREQERVLCFAWGTGKELWKLAAYDCPYQVSDIPPGHGPR